GGDGQVTLGNVVVKATARKVRKLYRDQVLAGFAGATADAFTLFERFEAKLEKHQGHLVRAAIELTKDWRTDRVLRRLEAKRAVAIALRNRWRRQQVDEKLRGEITPKNILMIGPTGVGKTEIARRLAKLADAPFIKVEATKFTEVGYVGKDVDSIVRDLVDMAVKQEREAAIRRHRTRAEDAAEERVLDILVPPARVGGSDFGLAPPSPPPDNTARQVMRKRLREGALADKEVEVEVAEPRAS